MRFCVQMILLLVVVMSLLLSACAGDQNQVPASTGSSGMTVMVQGESLAVPDGVDPALMENLAGELERVISARGKEPTAPVQGVMVDPLSRSDSGDDAVLSWTYNNSGDYNLDGLVGVSDLTPIGIHYNKSTASPDWAAASCADGTNDGLISVTDITPIGQNYGNFITNYVIEADIEGNDTWVPVANAARDTGAAGADSDWLEFEATVTNGGQCADFRVYAGDEVPADQLTELTIDPDAFRVDIYPWVITGMAPLQVKFDIEFTNATNPINVQVDYGDGSTVETGTSDFGDPLLFEHTYTTAGDWTASVSATDGDSSTDTASEPIHVDESTGPGILNPGHWEEVRLTSDEGSGANSAVALIDGKPWIIYTDDERNSVEFARSTVANPTSAGDWVMETIDGGPADHRGGVVDIVECYGTACVVYEGTTSSDMWFAAATSLEPWDETGWVKHEPDWEMAIGVPQLAVVNDRIALTYYGTSGTDTDLITWNPGVRYARGYVLDMDPPYDEVLIPPEDHGDWIITEVEGVSGQFYDYLQIGVSGGAPVLAYQRAQSGFKELRYAYADSNTPDTPANWTTMKVDDQEQNSGMQIHLMINPDGKPVLSYQNVDINEYILWAIADSSMPANPGAWAVSTVYQATHEDLGRNMGLGWFNNRPVISYTHHTDCSNLFVSYPTVNNPVDQSQWEHAALETASTYFINGNTDMFYLADGTLALVYRTTNGFTFAYFDGTI